MKKLAALTYITKGPLVLAVLNPTYSAWAFPGGKVEPNEMTIDAAYRELLEETGLIATSLQHVYCAPGTMDPSYECHVYAARTVGVERTIEPGNTVAWVTPHHLTASKAFGPFYEAFFEWMRVRIL